MITLFYYLQSVCLLLIISMAVFYLFVAIVEMFDEQDREEERINKALQRRRVALAAIAHAEYMSNPRRAPYAVRRFKR